MPKGNNIVVLVTHRLLVEKEYLSYYVDEGEVDVLFSFESLFINAITLARRGRYYLFLAFFFPNTNRNKILIEDIHSIKDLQVKGDEQYRVTK